jgi:hypothetical protein
MGYTYDLQVVYITSMDVSAGTKGKEGVGLQSKGSNEMTEEELKGGQPCSYKWLLGSCCGGFKPFSCVLTSCCAFLQPSVFWAFMRLGLECMKAEGSDKSTMVGLPRLCCKVMLDKLAREVDIFSYIETLCS